jgi:hypothetical protein
MLKAHNVQVVDHHQIAELAMRAGAAARKRAHLLLHEDHADPVQRLIIVLQPQTYVRPHHHSRQWEMLVLQQGRGNLLIFDGALDGSDRTEPTLVHGPNTDRGVAWLRRSGTEYCGVGDQARPLYSKRICRLGARGKRRKCK